MLRFASGEGVGGVEGRGCSAGGGRRGLGWGGVALVEDLRSRGLVYGTTDANIGVVLDDALTTAQTGSQRQTRVNEGLDSSDAGGGGDGGGGGGGHPKDECLLRPPAVYCGFDPTAR